MEVLLAALVNEACLIFLGIVNLMFDGFFSAFNDFVRLAMRYFGVTGVVNILKLLY